MHLTRVVITEDSKLLATRAHDSARSYNSCACLKYIGSSARQLVQSILPPLTSQRSLLCPELKSLKPFEDSTLFSCKHDTTFSFVWGTKTAATSCEWIIQISDGNCVASLVHSTSGIFGKFRELQAEVKRRTLTFPTGQVKSSWQQRCTR